jgi:hypothetical protein
MSKRFEGKSKAARPAQERETDSDSAWSGSGSGSRGAPFGYEIGRNQFGKEQFMWYVRRGNDGRLKCPYCAYRSFRNTQLKYHFMAQHVWLVESLSYQPTNLMEIFPTIAASAISTDAAAVDNKNEGELSPILSTTSTPPLSPLPPPAGYEDAASTHGNEFDSVSFSSDDTPYMNVQLEPLISLP